jgi:Tfp pilus assembly protein PilO
MSRNDRLILLAVPVLAAIVAFWFMVIAPKQDQVKKLDAQVAQLSSAVQTQQAAVQQGLTARKQFPKDYHRLVVMGKAVPVQDETASLIVQINKIAKSSKVSFEKMDLSQDTGAAAEAAAVAPTTPPPTPTSATEAEASLLPIGATVGTAGFPVLPFTLSFHGDYFQIANFMAGIDSLVNAKGDRIDSNGRLVTVNSFDMAPPDSGSGLDVNLEVTTYVVPRDQGLTAGATPVAPSGTTAEPASSTTSDTTSTTTGTTP